MPRIFKHLEVGCLQVNHMSTSAQMNQLKYTILYSTILCVCIHVHVRLYVCTHVHERACVHMYLCLVFMGEIKLYILLFNLYSA